MKTNAGFTSEETKKANREFNAIHEAADNDRHYANPEVAQSERERELRAEKQPRKLNVVRGKSAGVDPTTNPIRTTCDLQTLGEEIHFCKLQWLRHKDKAEEFSINPVSPMFNSPDTAEDVAIILKRWAYAADMMPANAPEFATTFHAIAREMAGRYRSGFDRLELDAVDQARWITRSIRNGSEPKPAATLRFAFLAAPILAAGWLDSRSIPGEIEDAILALDAAHKTATEQVRNARIPQA